MRHTLFALAALLSPMVPVGAQPAPTGEAARIDGPIPSGVMEEAVDLYNAANTVRAGGRLDIAADKQLSADVAVLNGPLVVSGRITGRVVAINANITLRAGATIDGSVLVLGGRVEQDPTATITGPVRVYRHGLWYHMTDDRLVAEAETETGGDCPVCRPEGMTSRASLTLFADPYNRVEGLPIYFGPRAQLWRNKNGFRVEALGVMRSAENFHWDSENVGHRVTAEVRRGAFHGVGIGGTLYDVVDPVENWQLSGTETSLAAALLHRDFRDYYGRHGGALTASLYSGPQFQVHAQYGDERWAARRVRDPWSLFRNSEAWRPNPSMGEGAIHVTTLSATVDTRNDARHPWAGWLATTSAEWGRGTLTASAGGGPQSTSYSRVLLDLRRYNRLSPNAQLNLRVVWGGRLGGDSLPLQRRLSVGGPGTLPGFAFRGFPAGEDVGQCTSGFVPPGAPALCERVALAQVEYRGALSFGLGSTSPTESGTEDALRLGWHGPAQWVAFADAGRGWRVGPRQSDLQYPAHFLLPGIGTFRTDIGGGIDLGPIGLYLATTVSRSGQPVRFFVRVGHRF